MLNIAEIENLETVPNPEQYPRSPWAMGVMHGEKYGGAFAAKSQEEADGWLLMLVGHRLRFDSYQLTWRKAFEREREALAWFAFAKDIGDWELYTKVGDELVERKDHREFVARFYKAALPESITGLAGADILERTHIRREKGAKSRGESYWRKGHSQPTQGGLFQ
jgi:hypothetical protein